MWVLLDAAAISADERRGCEFGEEIHYRGGLVIGIGLGRFVTND